MKAYPDTSFLCALYRLQANSTEAAAYFAAMPGPLEVTTLLLYEFRQAVRFQIRLHRHDPSKGYSRAEGAKMLADLKADLVSGEVTTIPAPWPQIHLAGVDSVNSTPMPVGTDQWTSSMWRLLLSWG